MKSSSVALDSMSINFIFFSTYFIQSIYKKKGKENFATGNAIYLLPMTIIQITNDNSIFRKEGICRFAITRVIVLESGYLFLTEGMSLPVT
jgi:hypothetical protein